MLTVASRAERPTAERMLVASAMSASRASAPTFICPSASAQ
jgi:hypothetical protein